MGRQKNLQNISFCHPFGVYSLVRPYTGVTLRFTPPACTLTSLRDYHFTDSNNLISTLKLPHNRQKIANGQLGQKNGQAETAAVSE